MAIVDRDIEINALNLLEVHAFLPRFPKVKTNRRNALSSDVEILVELHRLGFIERKAQHGAATVIAALRIGENQSIAGQVKTSAVLLRAQAHQPLLSVRLEDCLETISALGRKGCGPLRVAVGAVHALDFRRRLEAGDESLLPLRLEHRPACGCFRARGEATRAGQDGEKDEAHRFVNSSSCHDRNPFSRTVVPSTRYYGAVRQVLFSCGAFSDGMLELFRLPMVKPPSMRKSSPLT